MSKRWNDMRLLLDENAPKQWLPILQDRGHDAVHVIDRGWGGESDEFVFERALEEDRVLLTRNGFKRNPSRRDALNAMRGGLCIIRVTAKGLERLIPAIRQRIEAADQAFARDESLRRLTIMNDFEMRFENLDDVRRSLEEADT